MTQGVMLVGREGMTGSSTRSVDAYYSFRLLLRIIDDKVVSELSEAFVGHVVITVICILIRPY